jgi:hypothetical protein
LFTGATSSAFIVIHKGYSVIKYNTLFGALFYADSAFDASQAAGFSDCGAYGVAVGAEGKDNFFILWNNAEYSLGTFRHADFTAGAFSPINRGESVIPHEQCAEFANGDAVPKADAAPTAQFCPAGNFCPAAGTKSGI